MATDDARWPSAGPEEEPSPVEAAPTVPLREIFRRFWPYARPYRRWMPVMLGLAVLGPAVEAVGIWMFKVLVDEVLVPRDFGPLTWIVLAYLGLTVVGGVISFFDEYLSDRVGEGFILSLRDGFFRHVHGLSMGFFERRKLGDILSRLSGDVAAIENLLLSGIVSGVSYAFQVMFFVGAIFYLQWDLALMALLIVPLFMLAARYFSVRIKAAAREQRRRSGSIGAVAEESFSNAALVQAHNAREPEAGRFHRQNAANFRAQMAATRLEAAFAPLVDLIQLAGILVLIVVGAWQLSRGEISLGGLLVFVAYLTRLYNPIRNLSGLANDLFEATAGAERIIEFLDQEPAVEASPHARPLGSGARGIVELGDVSFRYPETEGPALENVSFRVEPGETLAMVGPSGSGKSTITKLLLRFYDPDSGVIRLDGHDLRDITLRSLRENVAVLFQEAPLLDASVRENIAFGMPDATDEEVEAAAGAADAHDFVLALPEGYDSRVGQKGRLLSGGQRQRIAIARALLRDAPVLVLDEPTTGLDTAAARRIMDPLRRLMEGRTTIIISHDPAAVREADRLVILEEGRIAETGDRHPPEDNGAYARPHRPEEGSSFAD